MHRVCWRSAWRLAEVALPLLFVLLAAPSADASCGDYVRIQHGTAHRFDAEPHLPSPGLPAHPVPCDGPNCSRGKPPLSAPVSTPTVVVRDLWACLVLVAATSEPDVARLRAAAAPPRLVRPLNSIYRPPRA